MKASHMNASSDFMFAKLHGRWASSFTENKIVRLVRGENIQVLARELAALPVSLEDRTQVQQQLNSHLIRELAGIRRFLSQGEAHFYTHFLDKFFFENLKTVLHYRYAATAEDDIRSLLVSSPVLEKFDIDELVEASSLHQFYRRLPDHPVKGEVLPILVELDSTRDLFVAESKLDILYYRSFLDAARELGRATRTTAEELVRTEIDISNAIVFLRNAAIYQLGRDTIRDLTIGGGMSIDAASIDKLLVCETRPEVEHSLPQPYGRTVGKAGDEPLYMCENRLWTLLHMKAYEAFNDFGNPVRAAIAFPFLKRAEHLNLGRVFEGLYLKLAPRLVETMLIGTFGV